MISADDAPAPADAQAVASIAAAGGVLVGTLNMDEYAYGFTTENSHYGPCRNPHDLDRVPGGSSGGSAAAVAAGLVPLALGSDTNGSIRVPAALCGVYGLKPTFGLISRDGVYPFARTLDHVGVIARDPADLGVVCSALYGERPGEQDGIEGPRVAIADDYFATGATPDAIEAVNRLAGALGTTRRVALPRVAQARAAAAVITAVEGAAVHLDDLRERAGELDPLTRERFLAGALVPAGAYLAAQRFRYWFCDALDTLFAEVDVLLAPATPFVAPPIGRPDVAVGDRVEYARMYLGRYTAPFSFAGLPALTVPVPSGRLPLGVQLVAAPGREATLLRLADQLEADGAAGAW
jgi:AtzE family amidohydrolase